MTLCVACACAPHNAHVIRGGIIGDRRRGWDLSSFFSLSGGILNPDHQRGILKKERKKNINQFGGSILELMLL